jgi:hypothetical protein
VVMDSSTAHLPPDDSQPNRFDRSALGGVLASFFGTPSAHVGSIAKFPFPADPRPWQRSFGGIRAGRKPNRDSRRKRA